MARETMLYRHDSAVCESVLAHVSLGELGEVCVPDVINMGPLEQRHSVLICLHKHIPFKNFTIQLAREQHWTNSVTVSTCSTSYVATCHVTLKASSK